MSLGGLQVRVSAHCALYDIFENSLILFPTREIVSFEVNFASGVAKICHVLIE